MNKLIHELQRLYFLQEQQWQNPKLGPRGSPNSPSEGVVTPELLAKSLQGATSVALNLVASDGMARAMIVGFERASDWEQVAKLYQGVQEDLELTAPAVAVSGRAGYQLWFSLTECVPVAQVLAFLDALRLKYLADVPLSSLKFRPDAGEFSTTGQSLVNLVPAIHEVTGKWSAFIDPTMGAMFVDEPGLGTAPNMDRQADILSRLKSIKPKDFQRALDILHPPIEAAPPCAERSAAEQMDGAGESAPDVGRMRSKLNVGNNYSDPKSFLLAVMNDPSARASQRIKAAKALLPYFNSTKSK